MITIYGAPQIASDSAKTILNWSKKEIVTHSSSYNGWRVDVIKQIQRKYCYKIDKPVTIQMCFHLNKKESPKRLFEVCNDIIHCMIECKTFNSFAIVTPKISQKLTEECPRVEITI